MAIYLAYNSELDISSRLAAEVRWFRGTGTRLWAADGLRGLKVEDGNSSSRQLNPIAVGIMAGRAAGHRLAAIK